MTPWHKYKAKKTTVDGETFPSKLEANVYAHHKLLQRAGEISELERHPTYVLSEAGIRYKADAKAKRKNGEEFAIEAKGVVTDRFRLIKKLWKTFGPYDLEIWVSNGKSIKCSEIVKGGNA